MNSRMIFFNSFFFNWWFLVNARPSKISLHQSYQVLWIHVIDAMWIQVSILRQNGGPQRWSLSKVVRPYRYRQPTHCRAVLPCLTQRFKTKVTSSNVFSLFFLKYILKDSFFFHCLYAVFLLFRPPERAACCNMSFCHKMARIGSFRMCSFTSRDFYCLC